MDSLEHQLKVYMARIYHILGVLPVSETLLFRQVMRISRICLQRRKNTMRAWNGIFVKVKINEWARLRRNELKVYGKP